MNLFDPLFYRKLGINVLPIRQDGSPIVKSWDNKSYYPEDLFLNGTKDQNFYGVAAIPAGCTKFGGLDIDLKYDISGDLFVKFLEKIGEISFELLGKLVYGSSKSDGRHIYYFTDHTGKSETLAARAATVDELKERPNLKSKALIELKEDGSLITIPFTPKYKFIKGSFETIPTLSKEEREILISVSKSFNTYIEVKEQKQRFKKQVSSISPFDAYNESEAILEELEARGWQIKKKGASYHLRNNDKKGAPHGTYKDGVLYFFSPNTGFPERQGLSGVQAYSILRGVYGDWKEMNKILLAEGYGQEVEYYQEDIPFPTEIPHAISQEQTIQFNYIPEIEVQGWKETIKQKIIKIKENDQVIELPSFPIDSLPFKLQSIIASVSGALDTPPDLLACSMMLAASTAVGHSVRLKLANGWTQSTALFMALVGDSAAGKSPALDFAFNLLKNTDLTMIEDFNHKNAEYEDSMSDKQTRGSVTKPIKKELILEDSTIESTLETLSANPHGVAFVVDEIAGWISSMNQYKTGKGGEEKKWLTIFDNRSLKKSTIGRGTTVIKSPFVNVIGGIQPQILHEIAKDGRNVDGFLYRFLFCISEQKPPKKWDELVSKSIPAETVNSWELILKNLLMIRELALKETLELQDKYTYVHLTHYSEAGRKWGKWYDQNTREIEKFRAEGKIEFISVLTKLSIICSRLILLNHMIITAVEEYTYDEILPEAVDAAIMQAEYFRQTSYYALNIIQENKEGATNKKETKCNWLKIFTNQSEIDAGLSSSEICQRIINLYGKSERTALSWLKTDLKEVKSKATDKRTKFYTI